MNFIEEYKVDEQVCVDLMKYFQKHKEHHNDGTKHRDNDIKVSIDCAVHTSSNNKTIRKYFDNILGFVDHYSDRYKILSPLKLSYAQNIQYYPPGGGFKAWHYERNKVEVGGQFVANRQLAYMTYLNNVSDEGETEFLYQQVKYKPEIGKTLIWPSDFTHYHRGIPSQSQEKYIITGWFVI